MNASPRTVELFVDPTCPYAWMTSRWLLNAVEQRPEFEAKFSVMSLAVLNEGRTLDPGYAAAMARAWNPARVMYRIQSEYERSHVSAFYSAWGERYHVGGNKRDNEGVAREALREAGIDDSLMDVWDREDVDASLRQEQAKVQAMVGDDVGTPVISFGEGIAYFGPVISPAPKGEQAGQLLDAMYTLSGVPGFYELKRARTSGIDFS